MQKTKCLSYVLPSTISPVTQKFHWLSCLFCFWFKKAKIKNKIVSCTNPLRRVHMELFPMFGPSGPLVRKTTQHFKSNGINFWKKYKIFFKNKSMLLLLINKLHNIFFYVDPSLQQCSEFLFFSRFLCHICVGLHSCYKVRLYELNLVTFVGLLEFLLLQLQTRNILGDKSELKLSVKKIIKICRSRSWDSDCMVIL